MRHFLLVAGPILSHFVFQVHKRRGVPRTRHAPGNRGRQPLHRLLHLGACGAACSPLDPSDHRASWTTPSFCSKQYSGWGGLPGHRVLTRRYLPSRLADSSQRTYQKCNACIWWSRWGSLVFISCAIYSKAWVMSSYFLSGCKDRRQLYINLC